MYSWHRLGKSSLCGEEPILGTKLSFAGHPWELLGTLVITENALGNLYGYRLNVVALGCLELDGEAETHVLIFCCVTVCKGNLVDRSSSVDGRWGTGAVECVTRARIEVLVDTVSCSLLLVNFICAS